MTLIEKINKLEKLIEESLIQLNMLIQANKLPDDTEQLKGVIETHITYAVFLKELIHDVQNSGKKDYSKVFLVSQFSLIEKSCSIVSEIYNENLDEL